MRLLKKNLFWGIFVISCFYNNCSAPLSTLDLPNNDRTENQSSNTPQGDSGNQSPPASNPILDKDTFCNFKSSQRNQYQLSNNPQNISELAQWIDTLPRPVTIPCVISLLKSPLKIYSIYGTVSAQQAPSFSSPRIFIINFPLIISIVVDGTSRNNMEVGELISSSTNDSVPLKSIKGDLLFPISSENGATSEQTLFERVLEAQGHHTSCNTCHGGEERLTEGIYKNKNAFTTFVIQPKDINRIPVSQILDFKIKCGTTNDERCLMIRSLFNNGYPQDIDFPK